MSARINNTITARRGTYNAQHPQEEFIVPLLKLHIENSLVKFAKTSASRAYALDVGCGQQPFRQKLESLGFSYVGFDVEQNAEKTVDILGAIDQELPAGLKEYRPFNFILCTEVLEHVADWHLAFKNFAELLCPEGRVLITCPHFYQLHEEPYDFWRPTPYALQYFAAKFGFKILEQNSAGDAWDILGTVLANCYPAPMSRKLKHRILTRLTRRTIKRLFIQLSKRQIQKAVKLEGPLYMSNILVLERL